MAALINVRKLSSLYNTIDVVKESAVIKTADNLLHIKVGVNFGVMGKLTRSTSIKLAANDIIGITKAKKLHEETIVEIIGMLEESVRWADNRLRFYEKLGDREMGQPGLFNLVLAEEDPLMINGVHKGQKVTLQFFGHGLFDMEMAFNIRKPETTRMFKARMDEMINHFRQHLLDLDNLKHTEIMEGVVA